MKHMKHPAQEEKYTGCLEIGRGKTCISLMNVSCIMFVAPSCVHHFIAIPSKAFFCLSFRRPHPISIRQIKLGLLAFPFAILLQTYSTSHNSQCLNVKLLGRTALLFLKLCFFPSTNACSLFTLFCFVDHFNFF